MTKVTTHIDINLLPTTSKYLAASDNLLTHTLPGKVARGSDTDAATKQIWLFKKYTRLSEKCGKLSEKCGKLSEERGKLSEERGKLSEECGKLSEECGKLPEECGKLPEECGKLPDLHFYQTKK
jgi:hypothetical protein